MQVRVRWPVRLRTKEEKMGLFNKEAQRREEVEIRRYQAMAQQAMVNHYAVADIRAQLIALAGPPLPPGTPQTPTKPLRARHVYALRGWRAVTLDGTTLKGATGATMSGRLSDVAVCKTRLEMPNPDECPHTPPVWDCTCGHYAVFNRAMLEPRSVVAEVTAIGPGIICGEGGKELGMRMRQYRLETLYVPEQCEKFMPMLERLYEVPVLLMPGNPKSTSAYAAGLQYAQLQALRQAAGATVPYQQNPYTPQMPGYPGIAPPPWPTSTGGASRSPLTPGTLGAIALARQEQARMEQTAADHQRWLATQQG